MNWRLVVALGVLGLLVYPVTVAELAKAAPAPTRWGLDFPADRIPVGAPAMMTIVGPPGASFIVLVTAPPWNGTSPVFTGGYTLPNGTAGRQASINVTLATAPLSTAEYQVQVQYRGLLVVSGWFWIIPTVNETVLNATVAEVYSQLIVDQEIILNDRQELAQLQQMEQVQWWAVIGSSAASLVGMAIAVALTRSPKSESARKFRDSWHGLWWKPDSTIMGTLDGYDPIPETPAPADQVYRGRLCATCRSVLYTEPEIRQHCLAAHSDVVGDAGPKLGIHYDKDERAIREVRRSSAPRTDSKGEAFVASRRGSLSIPFGEEDRGR